MLLATNMVPEALCFSIPDSSPSRGCDRAANKESCLHAWDGRTSQDMLMLLGSMVLTSQSELNLLTEPEHRARIREYR